MHTENRTHFSILVALTAIFVWSAISPFNYFLWLVEVLPGVLIVVLLIAIHKRFAFSTLVYSVLAIHAAISLVGAHYSYGNVRLFNWIRDAGFFERNNFDKLGHFAQGFAPVLVFRELYMRLTPLKKGWWLTGTVIATTLAFSASYEIVEWAGTAIYGGDGEAFMGTQGYVWDAQTDMLAALIGAVVSLWVMTNAHDKQIQQVGGEEGRLDEYRISGIISYPIYGRSGHYSFRSRERRDRSARTPAGLASR